MHLFTQTSYYVLIFRLYSRGILYGWISGRNKCKGYYELQPGELPADFTDICTCGGNLKFHHDFDNDYGVSSDSNEFILCDLCNPETSIIPYIVWNVV